MKLVYKMVFKYEHNFLPFLFLLFGLAHSYTDLFYLVNVGVGGYMLYLVHTPWHTQTIGMTLLGKGSACSRDLYLTTHDIHKRQTSMPPARLDPQTSGCLSAP
jgi:hypothetical protein